MNAQNEYGSCEYCGADKVQNPRTNKIFCSKKCWLTRPGAAPRQPNREQEFKQDLRDEGIKQMHKENNSGMDKLNLRNCRAQALDSATRIVTCTQLGVLTFDQALKKVEDLSDEFYAWITEDKWKQP